MSIQGERMREANKKLSPQEFMAIVGLYSRMAEDALNSGDREEMITALRQCVKLRTMERSQHSK